MSASSQATRLDLAELPVLDAKAFREQLQSSLRAGLRPITLYGRREAQHAVLTAVLQDASGGLQVQRCELTPETGYHELTSEFSALHCFERELLEQTGVRVAGHPFSKPIRYEGQQQSAMSAHPFYSIAGKEVHEVAVGPIHAGVIEPGSFRFMCHGEQVHHLEIQLGYQHRGVESLLLQRDPRKLAPLVETIAGDSSVAHTFAYCAALESLADCALPLQTEFARAVALELERVAMHLGALSGLCADAGFLQGAAGYGRLRTTAINTTMRLCGSRFGRGALRPGGIGMRLPAELLLQVNANLELLARDVAILDDCVRSSRTVQHRLRGAGVLSEAHARALGVVGVVARASGVDLDARAHHGAGAYHALPITTALAAEGDCYARACVRMDEIDASLHWLTTSLALYPRWTEERVELGALAPRQLAIAIVEGLRGEVVHCLETDADGALAHYKVQDPSLRNWMGLAIAVRDNEISDFPICNKSFDLSYCGNDL